MKQLLLVNSAAALNGGTSTPQDLTNMVKGGIGFYHLSDTSKWLAAAPTEDFAIVLGRGTNSNPIIIPEVDYDTLSVVKAVPSAGVKFSADITIPTVNPGETYTLVLVKNGTVPHERNTWTATETAQDKDTAVSIAKKLGDYFKAMAATGSIDITVTVASAKITITGVVTGEAWTLKAADALYGTTINTTVAEPAIGDKAYIANLASECAAGKGFTDVYPDGATIYPGYPEDVEDKQYNVYTLRFAVGRKSAKTRDERVSQLVHVAVPVGATAAATLDTMITGIKAKAASSSSTPAA